MTKRNIEIFPYGVTMGADRSRPVMLFRDGKSDVVVPVWLSPLEAGIAITQNHTSQGGSPHGLGLAMVKALNLQVEKCVFVEMKGSHQFVDVHFSGSRKLKVLRLRAEQAVSFCLQAKVRFYCTRAFVVACRDQTLRSFAVPETPLRLMEEMKSLRHPYLN